MVEGKIVTLDEIFEKQKPQNNYRPISEVLNTPLIVTGIDTEERQIGTMLIIHTTTGDCYTFSKVLIDQFMKLKKYLEEHKDVGGIQLVIRKKKRYYTIDSP